LKLHVAMIRSKVIDKWSLSDLFVMSRAEPQFVHGEQFQNMMRAEMRKLFEKSELTL